MTVLMTERIQGQIFTVESLFSNIAVEPVLVLAAPSIIENIGPFVSVN